MHTAAKVIARQARASEDAAYQVAGMLIVSLIPAMFWTLAVAGICSAVGHRPGAVALIGLGCAIAAFCAATFHAVISQRQR